ncbi:hypothetical protein [Nocardia crassostreae]|uniref:hypothetical protein n=1 Tax=Nocardia crassostreae TaxID=53428 RepID=UPI0012FA6AA8|nr:hypothetical protein [Nocardia crassostreae]
MDRDLPWTGWVLYDAASSGIAGLDLAVCRLGEFARRWDALTPLARTFADLVDHTRLDE